MSHIQFRKNKTAPNKIASIRKRPSAKELKPFEPSLYELYHLFCIRAKDRPNFKFQRLADGKVYIIDSVELIDSDWDFVIVAQVGGGNFGRFHWTELVDDQFLFARGQITATKSEITEKCFPHPAAQIRSEEFARNSVKASKIHFNARHDIGYVATLDGRFRNTDALIRHGILASNILLVERNPIVAIYEKLLAQIPGRQAKVIFGGIQDYFRDKPDLQSNLHSLYLDICGDIQPEFIDLLQSFPNLLFYAATRANRNCTGEIPTIPGFYLVKEFHQKSVSCYFYGKGKNQAEATRIWK